MTDRKASLSYQVLLGNLKCTSGHQSFLETIFNGLPSPNEAKISDLVSRFCSIDIGNCIDSAVRQEAILHKLYGLRSSKTYGGSALSNVDFLRFSDKISEYGDLSLGVHILAHQSVGYKAIELFGNRIQKENYLPPLVKGEKIAAFCITEPDSGSDIRSLKTEAKFDEQTGGFILKGQKIWITNGFESSTLTVFAKMNCPLDQRHHNKICAFIVDRDESLSINFIKDESKFGINKVSTSRIEFRGTKIPKENLLGDIGDGMHIAKSVLNHGRLCLSASTCGALRYALRKSQHFTSQRKLFSYNLNRFGILKEKLKKNCQDLYINQTLTYLMGIQLDALNDNNLSYDIRDFANQISIAKIFGSQSAFGAIDNCMQMLGGHGFVHSLDLHSKYKDLRVFRIFEGTNEVLKIAIGQNLMREYFLARSNDYLGTIKILGERYLSGFSKICPMIFLQGNIAAIIPCEMRHQVKPIAKIIKMYNSDFKWAIMRLKKMLFVDHQHLLEAFVDIHSNIIIIVSVLQRYKNRQVFSRMVGNDAVYEDELGLVISVIESKLLECENLLRLIKFKISKF
ncbi:MAG: hypothetical protein MHMPM18_001760 [Marteilia pararefringens]